MKTNELIAAIGAMVDTKIAAALGNAPTVPVVGATAAPIVARKPKTIPQAVLTPAGPVVKPQATKPLYRAWSIGGTANAKGEPNVSNAGYPFIRLETRTSIGGTFTAVLPADAALFILQHTAEVQEAVDAAFALVGVTKQ